MRSLTFNFQFSIFNFPLSTELSVGSTIWAGRNVASKGDPGGVLVENASDYGGYFTWTDATTITYGGSSSSTRAVEPGTGLKPSGYYMCPSEWRLPTSDEISALIAYGGTNTAYNGVAGWGFEIDGNWLFFPYSGCDGGTDRGVHGGYWSSAEYSAAIAYYLLVGSGNSTGHLNIGYKTYAYSVRCVKSA